MGRGQEARRRFLQVYKDQKADLVAALEYYAPEAKATIQRLVETAHRVAQVRSRLYDKRRTEMERAGKRPNKVEEEFPKLTECMNMPKSFATDMTSVVTEKVKDKTFAKDWKIPEENQWPK